jgi:glyoxylase-like metal-dependent hydrolase (beta-lactamase superfamily II)/rhodanese-related sulfurtransferase
MPIVEQYYTKCLAQGTYYISSAGEAAVIDPLREVQQYIDRAESSCEKIKYIFLTHFHADFVSGHVDLADKTGATIVIGPGAETSYAFAKAEHKQTFSIGDISLQLLHTPGHTLESSCYLLRDEDGQEQALFTGDTLFIGDVGRPDLAVKSDLTKEDLAGKLYVSLHSVIMPLPDHITVYPAHGAGSACGKNMSSETSDKLGNQKKTNYALDTSLSREDFIREVSSNIAPPPAYFPKNVMMNKGVNSSIDEVLRRGAEGIKPHAFKALADDPDFLVLDVRSPQEFTAGHVPGSWFIGLDGQFAPWVGTLIENIDQKIVLVTPQGREEEAVTRLARVGYDNSQGYLKGGIAAWQEAGYEIAKINDVAAQDFVNQFEAGRIANPLDVRKPTEYATSHIPDVQLLPLSQVTERMDELIPENHYYIHCAGGYRSVIFASILKSHGFDKLTNILGGYGAIKKAGHTTLQLENN